MRFVQTPIEGLMVFEPNLFTDVRGKFVKPYNDDFFRAHGLDITIKESYYSLSTKDVIRGMHFQTPPHDHIKIVYVPNGKIIDVVLDIRKGSPTFGIFFDIELSAENGKILIISKGLAHGFKSLEDNTNVTYMQTSCYAPENDFGIHYDSFGYDWGITQPSLSDRDASFVFLDEFDSPFVYGERE
jgi:dTDP-4-dehydrorhamnose 3,5-epimerase/CDP-3, 6-dideoxy-D-glycero-D-glycero-4-hexulose-5-epimerase